MARPTEAQHGQHRLQRSCRSLDAVGVRSSCDAHAAHHTSVLSSISLYIAVGAASRLAALLLGHTCPMCFLVAPGQPGASPPAMYRSVELRTLATRASQPPFHLVQNLHSRPPERKVDMFRHGCGVDVDLHGEGATMLGLVKKSGRRLDEGRCADRQKKVAHGRRQTLFDDGGIDRLPEPDNARSCQAVTMRTSRRDVR